MHYMRWWRHSDPLIKIPDGTQGCQVEDCQGVHHAKGWCAKHLRQMDISSKISVLENQKSRYHANVEVMRARAIQNYWAHRDSRMKTHRAWKQKHPEKTRALEEKRRARLHGASLVDLTSHQWEAIKRAFHDRCAYCGTHPRRLEKDHITPISQGGNHTMSNVVPACRRCNAKKSTGAPLCPVQPLLLVM